jgi:hypothetical protein
MKMLNPFGFFKEDPCRIIASSVILIINISILFGGEMVISKASSQNTGNKQEGQDIDCFACIHFFITFDQAFPYGCKAAGFKSCTLPAKDMYANSGIACQLFQPKRKAC